MKVRRQMNNDRKKATITTLIVLLSSLLAAFVISKDNHCIIFYDVSLAFLDSAAIRVIKMRIKTRPSPISKLEHKKTTTQRIATLVWSFFLLSPLTGLPSVVFESLTGPSFFRSPFLALF